MGVATNITWWAILHLKAFLWSCLPLEEIAQECLLAEDLACNQKLQLGMEELGNTTIVFSEKQDAGGLPLICWRGPGDGKKGVSAEIPKPGAAAPKTADSTTLDLNCHSKESCLSFVAPFGFINKFVQLPCHQPNNNPC